MYSPVGRTFILALSRLRCSTYNSLALGSLSLPYFIAYDIALPSPPTSSLLYPMILQTNLSEFVDSSGLNISPNLELVRRPWRRRCQISFSAWPQILLSTRERALLSTVCSEVYYAYGFSENGVSTVSSSERKCIGCDGLKSSRGSI